MKSSEDFWAFRACFLMPIPELATAADLLDAAADALLAGDHDRAREQLRNANIHEVRVFAARIMGSWDTAIHRRRHVERPLGVAKVRIRKPSQTVEAQVFARDGCRCRYCGVRVVLPKARKLLVDTFPDVICWSGEDKDLHAAFYALSAVADHVVPHALGGDSGVGNLVTTCQCCNYGKGDRLLTELGLHDPRTRLPVVDRWDGLGRLLFRREVALPVLRAPRAAAGATGKVPSRPSSRDTWFANLDRVHAGVSARLLRFLTDCEALGVSWGLKDHLIIRLTAGGATLQIVGVAPDGEVVVPWLIGTQKDQFRGFAVTIASALPEARVHESPTQWIVTRDGRTRLHVRDLLDISPVLRDAIRTLAARIASAQNATHDVLSPSVASEDVVEIC